MIFSTEKAINVKYIIYILCILSIIELVVIMFLYAALLITIKYDSMAMNFLLVSCIACCCSHGCAGAQASRSMQAPGCRHGVPHYPGVCLTSARWGGTKGPPLAGHAGLSPAARRRSVAQLTAMARP